MIFEADALLFDSDGVLIDSLAHGEAAWTQLAGEFGLDIDVILTELHGVRAADTLARHVPLVHLQAAIDRLEDLEVELAPKSTPIPGSIELTASLPPASWTIVTSATRRLAVARWRAAGITLPDITITAEDVERGKPDPEPYARGATALGTDAQRCIVFEDAPSGGRAGGEAGARVVAIGNDEWDVEPIARVPDLRAVRVLGTEPRLTIEVGAG
ncbi:MAG: HAD-IA family hydrolase [Ilumatobacter sp.]